MPDIEPYPVTSLKLDSQNPRLPTLLQGRLESEVLSYLFTAGALEELAQSFLDNGFFAHEPLIILDQADDQLRHVVLEGNRRLATLKILFSSPEAEGLRFAALDPSDTELGMLETVPCFAISDRHDVHRFLGFRHIGGLKKWSSEAKARYLLGEVRRLAEDNEGNPFREVGRRVGSNALGVRNPYIAIRILQCVADELSVDTQFVQYDRFGVWLRCMNSSDIRDYLGLGSPKTYAEVEESLRIIDLKRVAEIIADLTKEGKVSAVLSDSRQVTDYGRVLQNQRAHKALRKHRDLSLAIQVADQEQLGLRIDRIATMCRILLDELPFADPIKDDLGYAESLFTYSRAIRTLIRDHLSGDDED